MIRSFIALSIPGAPKLAACRVISELKEAGTDVKWVRPEGLHLTLKFLGEVEDTRLSEIITAMHEVCAGTGPLNLGLSGVGAFPSVRKPQVVWLGVAGALADLAGVAGNVTRAMAELGFEPEKRKFRPHLTLGRLPKRRGGGKSPPLAPLARAIAGLAAWNGPEFVSDKVLLMKSTLTAQGAVYKPLHQVVLTGD